MLPPIGVALFFGDGTWDVFGASLLLISCTKLLIWWSVRRERRKLRLRYGVLVVALFCVVNETFGVTPCLLTERPEMSFTGAVFESISGLTPTGATVLVGLEDLP